MILQTDRGTISTKELLQRARSCAQDDGITLAELTMLALAREVLAREFSKKRREASRESWRNSILAYYEESHALRVERCPHISTTYPDDQGLVTCFSCHKEFYPGEEKEEGEL